ncbi:MAG: 50S ribosomal protein L11 methyltransferase, partial [Tissierellaceae bacterium]
MKWAEVQIKTTPEKEEIISSILYDVGATGLAIEDPRDIFEISKTPESWSFVDLEDLDLDFDLILIKAYFSEAEDLDHILQDIRNRIKDNPTLRIQDHGLVINIINDEDYAENWKKYYKTTRIGDRIVIKPSWEEYSIEEGDILVELDPGMAFGTGTHETTAMCAQALEEYIREGDIVYDIGCGSGILSIIAAKLGASKVLAVDNDPVSIDVSIENINLNDVEDIVEVRKGNLLDIVEGKANVIVSNIIAEIIVKMVKVLKNHLEDGGIFISSGIIEDKIQMVEDSLLANGLKIVDKIKLNQWALIIASND